jgi:hypothetical protein
MEIQFSDQLLQAAREYAWMLNNGYPQKSSLKLVGDKFLLTRDKRQILYRGISAVEPAERRRAMLGKVRKGDLVLLDTHNVLFTMYNYLLGRPVFISNDGILRDAGETRGRILNGSVFRKAVDLLLQSLGEWNGATLKLFLDEPVSFSGRLATELTERMVQSGIDGEARTVPSPDHLLKNEKSDVICTSDTAILDHYVGRVFDLPRVSLEKSYQPDFPALDL